MGLRQALAQLAAGAPVPVFAVAGAGARERVADLRLSREIELVDEPAAAQLLLIGGLVPDVLSAPLAAVHDAMPGPRCTVFWPLGASTMPALMVPHAVRIPDSEDPVAIIVQAQRAVLTGIRASDPPLLPDVDPNPWRGIGPYGQGGSGMTGGTPYGRPMAELGPDRDGLRLDLLPLAIGPFFPRFPTGLIVEVTMAGDLVVEAAIAGSPFAALGADATARRGLQPFLRALSEPVSIAELEVARARDHLRWAAGTLLTQGLRALAARVLRLARSATPAEASAVASLTRHLELVRVPQWSGAGIGCLDRGLLAGLGVGPIGRAAGLAEDARTEDPSYMALGFEPVVMHGGDAAARWRLRMAEAVQSLELAGRAGARRTRTTGLVESPRGRLAAGDAPFERLRPLLATLLANLEWGDAVTTIVSLDLDLEEAGLVSSSRVGAEAA